MATRMSRWSLIAVVAALLAVGCGAGGGSGGEQDGGSTGGADADGDSDGDTDADADSDSDADTDTDTSEGPDVPSATGPCPEFKEGTLAFAPAGLAAQRSARVWISNQADAKDGPIIFYWHGTGSSPAEALVGLGLKTINEVKSLGGMVVAPVADPAAGQYPWFLVSGNKQDDLVLMDEILGCAVQKKGIDTRRIHSIGMSAGGLQTAQVSFRRSGYIASAVTYSGGVITGSPPDQDPTNRFAAMIFHGGASDVQVVSFQTASENYHALLDQTGRFSFLCNHGQGHTIPTGAVASVWRFFQDHPYGTDPSPYESGLPAGFPSYCSL
jgi:predicted esterase